MLDALAALDFANLAAEIFALFVPEDECPDLRALIRSAFAKQRAPPVTLVGALHVAELFHGPSLSFKDIAVAPAVALLSYFLSKAQAQQCAVVVPPTVLVATSGDTGPSVLAACEGTSLRAICLFPEGRVARRQAAQMTSRNVPGQRVFQVANATSDDLDVVLARLFADEALRARSQIGTLNSLNFARILGQVVIYFWVHLRCPAARYVVVPTGAMGSLTAGLIARRMGLPVDFVCANNANDSGVAFFERGVVVKDPPVTPTVSPAMDIAVPYNWERVAFLAFGPERTAAMVSDLEATGRATVPGRVPGVRACSASEAETLAAMRRAHDEFAYAIDPHTAVGVAAGGTCLGADLFAACGHGSGGRADNGGEAVVLATASPLKFDEGVARALERPLQPMAEARNFAARVALADAEAAVRQALLGHF